MTTALPSHSPYYIRGCGAVSPAGLSSRELFQACVQAYHLPSELLEGTTIRARRVDSMALQNVLPKHPRLRRASPITKFAIKASLEALGDATIESVKSGNYRLGIVVSLLNGCIQYTRRFYEELIDTPELASPILFPETVFNAPASHVASILGVTGPCYTLIGDTGGFFTAIKTAANWMEDSIVDGCLVICAEEADWLTAEGLGLYSDQLIATEGAVAIHLDASPAPIQLSSLSGPFPYRNRQERRQAIKYAYDSSPTSNAQFTLIDGCTDVAKIDQDETALLCDLPNSIQSNRLSPLMTLGSGMGVNAGFQTAVATEMLKQKQASETHLLATGSNQHAYFAKFQSVSDSS